MGDGPIKDLLFVWLKNRRIVFLPVIGFFPVRREGEKNLILRNEVQGVLIVGIDEMDFLILSCLVQADSLVAEMLDLSEGETVP